MPRRTKEEALATRDRILDTAELIFEKKGVSQTALEDIARAAGVTRGAIYGHFKNKRDLFVAMFERVHLPMDALYAKGTDDHLDPLGRLREIFVIMLRAVSSRRRDQRVLNISLHKCELAGEMSGFISRYRMIGRKEARRVRTILQHAKDQRQLPASLDVRKAEILLQATLMGLIGNWTLNPKDFPLNRDAEAYVDALIDALRASTALQDA